MSQISRRSLIKRGGAAALLPMASIHISSAEAARRNGEENARSERSLVLLLVNFTHPERDLVAMTLGAMAKCNGVQFEAYCATNHGDEGIFSPQGSTLLGGRHEIPLSRALAEYQTTVVILGDMHVFTSLVKVGAVRTLRVNNVIEAASQLAESYGWAFPRTAIAVQMTDLPAALEDIHPYLVPEIVHRQAIAVSVASSEEQIERLRKLGVSKVLTIASPSGVPESWSRYGFRTEKAEEFVSDDTLYSATFRIAKRWVEQARGIDLCEPVMAAHWVPFSIREDRLMMCSSPSTKEAIEGIVQLARPWPDPVVYGRWGGGSVKVADDKQSRSTACYLKSECNAGLAECLFLNGRPPSVVLSKAIDGSFLDSAFFTFLEQQQPRVDTMSISGFFWQAMIHSPASIPIGNETDVTRDIIFRHCTVSLTELYFPQIEAIDKVQIARSATARTDRQLARQGRFSSGSEGDCLFMPHINPLDPLASTH